MELKKWLWLLFIIILFQQVNATQIAPLSPFSEPWIDEATGKEMVALGVSYDKSREAEVLSFLAKFPNITIHKPIENRVNFSLPRDQEAELRKCDAIQHIYPMGAVEAELDVSNGYAKNIDDRGNSTSYFAYNTRAKAAHDVGYTGKDVLIAIIDDGIDIFHPSFHEKYHPDNSLISTRIKYYTVIPPAPGEVAEYNDRQLNSYINTGNNIPEIFQRSSTGKHGTGVAGCAAGNGQFYHDINTDYIGTAPEANLLIAHLKELDKNNVLAAVEWSIDKAKTLGKDLVINISSGTRRGSRDGTSPYDRDIAKLSKDNDVAIVTSSGNDANKKWHVGGICGGTIHFETALPHLNPGMVEAFIYVWYSSYSSYKVRVRTPTGRIVPTAPVGENNWYPEMFAPGSTYAWYAGEPGVAIYHEISDNILNGFRIPPSDWAGNTFPLTSDKLIVIAIGGHATGGGTLGMRAGDWEIRLLQEGPMTYGRWDAYIVHTTIDNLNPSTSLDVDDYFKIKFSEDNGDFFNTRSTITEPATANGIIAVGSLTSSEYWKNTQGSITDGGSDLGCISQFSSEGPIRGGLFDNFDKPEIYAPGEHICKPLSHYADVPTFEYLPFGLQHHGFSYSKGTSFSSPMVAGAIAVYLQKYPRATVRQIRRALEACDYANGRHVLDIAKLLQLPAPRESVPDDEVPQVDTNNTTLFDNYPNPFNPRTVIKFNIAPSETGTLIIYNIKGELIKKYDNLSSDNSYITWEGNNSQGNPVSSGIYLYMLKTNSTLQTKKMLLLK